MSNIVQKSMSYSDLITNVYKDSVLLHQHLSVNIKIRVSLKDSNNQRITIVSGKIREPNTRFAD